MKSRLSRNPIAFLCLVITLCFLFVTIASLLKLPDQVQAPPIRIRRSSGRGAARNPKTSELGRLGEMMIEMLPQDLAFTAFIPSERAFRRDAGLEASGSVSDDNTYAVVSRILGFSVIPRTVVGSELASGEEECYDSLCGLTLCVWRDGDGALVVNGVKAEKMGVKRGKVLVHVVDGVIMDAHFQQSINSDGEER